MSCTATPLLDEAHERARFPAPLSVALEILFSETEHSGPETTADEMAAAIEALFLHLGRLWVAEYLRAVQAGEVEACEAIQRDLVERLASGRPVHTGAWVALARGIREHLTGRGSSGPSTVLEGLAAVDFGAVEDTDHPVSRLMRFRNDFSHGSFGSTVEEIGRQRVLLNDLLARVPALREQPILCRDAESGVVLAATGLWPVAEPPEGEPLPVGRPVLVGTDGRRLDLYPLLTVAPSEDGRRLVGFSAEHPARELARHPALSVWVERYAREREGFLGYSSSGVPVLPPEAADALRARLAVERPGLVLLEGHPGCGTAGAVAALEQADPLGLGLDRYAAVGRVAVAPGEVGQSGLSVARLVLRLAERALGRRPGSTASDLRDILQDNGPLRGLLREVEAADRRLLLGLQDLQHGREPYRGEPLSVVQVYEALVGSAVDVVATTVPAGLERTLFDERLVVPVAEHPDPAEVTAWVRTLCAGEPMRRRVLRQLAGAAGPQDLFEVCEGLERWGGEAVFEPEVERALWDLRPLLGWDRAEVERDGGERQRVRTWYLFSDVVAAALDADAGADGGVGS